MKKFIVLTTQRTGSTLLWRYLDLCPEVDAHGEIFLKSMKRPDSYSSFIKTYKLGFVLNFLAKRKMISKYLDELCTISKDKKAVGFKLMYNQNNDILKRIIRENDFHIIHLIRRNYLKVIISRETARIRSLYHVTENVAINTAKIKLDSSDILEKLLEIKNEVIENRKEFGQLKYVELFYEDFILEKDLETKNILEFLGLKNQDLKGEEFPLKKINSDKIEDVLENYNEIEAVVKESEFRAFLN